MKDITYIDEAHPARRSQKIDASAKKVTVACTTKHAGKDVQCDWTFDFSDCTPDEVYALATKSVVIMQQAPFRKVGTLSAKDVKCTIDVHALLNTPKVRAPADPATTVRNNVKKLTAEQKAALLAELQADAAPAGDSDK